MIKIRRIISKLISVEIIEAVIIYWGNVHEASGSPLARHFQVVIAWGFLIFTVVRYLDSEGRYA